jgi:hypothetical protein
MKKVIVLYVILVAAVALNACDGDKIKQLNDQVAALGADNTILKAKIGDLEKARVDMTGTISVLQADRDAARKALEECAAKDKPKDGDKTKDNGKNGKTPADHAKGGKGAGDNGKAKPADGGKTKPTFKPPKKVK